MLAFCLPKIYEIFYQNKFLSQRINFVYSVFMIRKIWLSLFLIGVSLELLSLYVQRQVILSGISLLFSFAVYYFCYQKKHTRLLTMIIWSYWFLLGLFVAVCSSLYYAHHYGNAAVFIRQIQMTGRFNWVAISVFVLSGLYLVSYVYATILLRRQNRLERV